MNSIYKLLSYVAWIFIILLAAMNIAGVTHIDIVSAQGAAFLADKLHLTVPVTAFYIKTPVLYVILFALGEIAGICYLLPLYNSMQEKTKAYRRELEKGSVTNSTSTSKIEVLENKIQVLEKALDDALKNQNNN